MINEDLDKINKAIEAIEGGAQEYQIGSRRIRKADLSILYSERRRIRQEIDDQNGYGTTVAVFERR